MGKWYDYDFGQSRKEKYVGPGTGSITVTPDRKGYSKTGSGKRMKISERNTYKNSENPIFALELHKTVLADKYGYGERSKPSPKPADVSGQFAEKSVEPTSHEIFRAVRRLEDNPGLHQAYVGKASGSQSQKARKEKVWDGSVKGDFPKGFFKNRKQ